MQAPIIITNKTITIISPSSNNNNPNNVIINNTANGNSTLVIISSIVFRRYEIMSNEMNESPIGSSVMIVFMKRCLYM